MRFKPYAHFSANCQGCNKLIRKANVVSLYGKRYCQACADFITEKRSHGYVPRWQR